MGIPLLDARLTHVCQFKGIPWQQRTNFTAGYFQGVALCWRGTLVKVNGLVLTASGSSFLSSA